MLAQREQPVLHGRHRDSGLGMGVDDAVDIVAAAMDRAVNDESGPVHGGIGLIDQVAVEIDLDEVGGGHLVEQQPEAVEQKVAGLVRDARRNVRIDQIGPAEMLDQTVTGRELDALSSHSDVEAELAALKAGGSGTPQALGTGTAGAIEAQPSATTPVETRKLQEEA